MVLNKDEEHNDVTDFPTFPSVPLSGVQGSLTIESCTSTVGWPPKVEPWVTVR